MVVERRVSRGERGGETIVHHGINKLSALCEEQFPNVVQRESSLLHRVRHSHGLEVTTMMNFSGLTINQRVVGGYRGLVNNEHNQTLQHTLELHS